MAETTLKSLESLWSPIWGSPKSLQDLYVVDSLVDGFAEQMFDGLGSLYGFTHY